MRHVVLTGSAGRIGSVLCDALPSLGWKVRPFDLASGSDITSPTALDAVVPGAEAIVHLAGQPTEAPWPVIRAANLEGTFQVFEAARRHGVRRVVYASSNHAVGFTPVEGELAADIPARPDTLYGVSKIFGEALGRYYTDRYALQIACLRIGTFAAAPPDQRALSTWLSPADCTRLVDACLRSANLTYSIVWGVSANTRRAWSLAAGEALGYFPADDAELYAASLPDAQSYPSDAYVGGGFTAEGFGIDEVQSRW